MNVELEPGFQTNEQKRDNCKCSFQYLISVPVEINNAFTRIHYILTLLFDLIVRIVSSFPLFRDYNGK